MRGSILAGLASSLAFAGAHPGGHAHGIVGRGIDINPFRLKATSEYVNASVAESPSAARRSRRGDYVGAATDLVKSLVNANGASYRVVEDHYIGTNSIAHVNFKQTANGLDIDNADINVNVSAIWFSPYDPILNLDRLTQMVLSSHMEARSFPATSLPARLPSATSPTQWMP
jgi:extracellular elastinolytic metalloproteinase